MNRCRWCEGNELYEQYHDQEWGVPVHNDRKHFEFLVLESAQAGLSWITILKRREGYRQAFANFDYEKVAQFTDQDVKRLMENENIIRYDKKIESAINNAKKFIEIRNEFGSFDHYIWGFVDHEPIVNQWETIEENPSKTKLSETIAKDLKKRGFNFLGPTTVYAYMQAVGLVNDHIVDCFRYNEILAQY